MKGLAYGLLVAALLLGACGGQTGVATQTPGAASSAVAATPLPLITTIPTPAADKSTVTGVLKSGAGSGSPAVEMLLYLGAILPEAQGTPYLASFDRTESPKSITDGNGRFLFTDIMPGQYALILDRVFQSYMLDDPKQAKADFIIQAQAGKIVDLGDLVYASLPGHGP